MSLNLPENKIKYYVFMLNFKQIQVLGLCNLKIPTYVVLLLLLRLL